MQQFEIRLENVRLFANHGVFNHERRDGNEFEINLCVKYTRPFSHSEQSEIADDIANTVSYAGLWDIVRDEMSKPRNLLETVASSIVEKIKSEFADLEFIECKISKLQPPIKGFIGSASVTCLFYSDKQP